MTFLVWDPVDEFEPGAEGTPIDRRNEVDAYVPSEAAELYAERIYEEIEFDTVDLMVRAPDGKLFRVSVRVDFDVAFRTAEVDEVTRGQ